MALDIVFEHPDLYPNEEYHLEVMESFKFELYERFNVNTINRQVVVFYYNPDTRKFKLKSVIRKYRHNIEFIINCHKSLRWQME